MAKGTANGRAGWVAAGLIVLVVLVSTNTWNPFPELWDWVNTSQPLSSSGVAWQQRLGGGPKSVTIAGNTAVVEHRTSVEARSLASGVRLWEKEADWAAVAGEADSAVVVSGQLLVKGYEVINPATGALLRKDTRAVGVWTYRNALLDVRCGDAKDCTLTAWDPRGSSPLWTAELPGVGFVLFADNPDLLDAKPLTARRVASEASGPVLMPPLLAFPIDGGIQVVDTALGRVVQDIQPDRRDRYVAVGGRVLRVQARAQDGTCYFTVTATDPGTGREAWRLDAVNLRTAGGSGCAQRDDPAGGQNVIVGVAGDGRQVVVDAYDGRLLWVGRKGDELLAVDDRYAIARPADGKAVVAYELTAERARWSRPTGDPKTQAALTRFAAVVVSQDPDRIAALTPATGRELVNLRSSAKVLAVGPAGMIIGEGREIGYVKFAGVDATTPAPADDSLCDGPKEPGCGAEK